MNKIRFITVFLVLFVFAASGLFAQRNAQANAQALTFGSRTNGTLRRNSEVWYSLTPNQNSFIVIEVSSDDFDTFVEVYDSGNVLIGEDDDGGEGTNSKFEVYGERGNTYLIKVRSYDREEGGSFRILASLKAVPQALELRFGNPRSVNLGRGDEHWYSVRANEAGLIIVETQGDDVNTYLEAFDSSYRYLDSNDDGGVGTNARITLVVEPGQTYFLKLRGYNDSARGPYRIVSNFEGIPEDPGNTERARAISINIGDSRSSFFHTNDEERWFRFTVPRGGATVVIYTTSGLDTVMTLYDNNRAIAEDDDSGEHLNALISQRLSAGSSYFVRVTTYGGGIGHFSISVENN